MIDSLYDTKDQYLAIQKDQLYTGVDSRGSHLLTYKNKYYARKKNEMNPIPGYGNPDLRLTGAFYNAMKADVNSEGLTVYSTDQKAGMLEAKYGKSIFTLFEEWRDDYLMLLQPIFVENLSNSLQQFDEAPF